MNQTLLSGGAGVGEMVVRRGGRSGDGGEVVGVVSKAQIFLRKEFY